MAHRRAREESERRGAQARRPSVDRDETGHAAGAPAVLRGSDNRAARPAGFYGSRRRDGRVTGVIGHVGQSGTGKTYDALAKIADSERVIFFDTKGDIGHGERQ